MGERYYEIRPLVAAQLLDEFAQALDAGRIHSSEFRRRLTFASPDIGQAYDGYFHALPLQRDRSGEQTASSHFVVEIVANDRTVESRHGLFEPLGAVGRLPIAGGENIDTEGLEGFEDHFSFGPCSRTRTLELIASIQQKAGPLAVRSLMFDSGLEAGVAAHHLDFGRRSRQIFGMRFELRMRIGEVQKRHPFAFSTMSRSRR